MIDKSALVDERISRVLTQYRESPNLLGMIEAYLSVMAGVMERADAIPTAFDLETSTGDQLTKIGQWLGFPRAHPSGSRVRPFGFERPSLPSVTYPAAGLCDSRFIGPTSKFEAKTFSDDAEYRKFLTARAVSVDAAMTRRYTRDVLSDAATALFGDDVLIVRDGGGEVTLCLTRYFTASEMDTLHLAAEVMPLPLGVRILWAHSNGTPFGSGTGWGDFCTSAFYGVIRETVVERPVSDAFGFGPGFSGFCAGRFFPLT